MAHKRHLSCNGQLYCKLLNCRLPTILPHNLSKQSPQAGHTPFPYLNTMESHCIALDLSLLYQSHLVLDCSRLSNQILSARDSESAALEHCLSGDTDYLFQLCSRHRHFVALIFSFLITAMVNRQDVSLPFPATSPRSGGWQGFPRQPHTNHGHPMVRGRTRTAPGPAGRRRVHGPNHPSWTTPPWKHSKARLLARRLRPARGITPPAAGPPHRGGRISFRQDSGWK